MKTPITFFAILLFTTNLFAQSIEELIEHEIPFVENWDEGSFEFNGWQVSEDSAWAINNDIGNPEPSASFRAAMITEDSVYSSSLSSNLLVADHFTVGEIYLDFDLKLDVIEATGDERMFFECSRDSGDTWQRISGISNYNGSIEFTEGSHHHNITHFVRGYNFQLRFTATGQNASDIANWFIDNIHVYRSCIAPKYLEGAYTWNNDGWGAKIAWKAPGTGAYGKWLHWGNTVYGGGAGIVEGGTWSLAQRWDAGQLTNWQGMDWTGVPINEISIVLNDDGFDSLILKIWSGPNAETLLYQQIINYPVPGDIMSVTLDSSVYFDVNKELWIGYTLVNQPVGWLPGGYDTGPAVVGYGDMFSTDGGLSWERLSDAGTNHNWYIHATTKQSVAYSPISGFNLYRQEVNVEDDYVLYAMVPYVVDQKLYEYLDLAPDVSEGQTYNYKVTALWEIDDDSCESDPAMNIDLTEDYVTILVTEIEDNKEQKVIIYPNPAVSRLNISSDTPLESIEIFNTVGQVVFERKIHKEKNFSVNTEALMPGIYLVKIKAEDVVIIRRMVVSQ